MIVFKDDKFQGLGAMPHKALSFKLSGGLDSGPQTVKIISAISHEFKKDPLIRNLSVRLVHDLDSNDYLGEIRRVYEWVRDHVRYIRDIRGCETLQTPDVTLPNNVSPLLGIGAGDCDDHVTLLATMLLSIGVKDVFAKIVAYDKYASEFQHIYLVVKYKDKFYPMDAIKKSGSFGWEPKHAISKLIRISY